MEWKEEREDKDSEEHSQRFFAPSPTRLSSAPTRASFGYTEFPRKYVVPESEDSEARRGREEVSVTHSMPPAVHLQEFESSARMGVSLWNTSVEDSAEADTPDLMDYSWRRNGASKRVEALLSAGRDPSRKTTKEICIEKEYGIGKWDGLDVLNDQKRRIKFDAAFPTEIPQRFEHYDLDPSSLRRDAMLRKLRSQ